MLKQDKIERAIEEMSRQQGIEINGQDRLMIRSRVAGAIAAKERYRQRMSAGPYQWKKPAPPR